MKSRVGFTFVVALWLVAVCSLGPLKAAQEQKDNADQKTKETADHVIKIDGVSGKVLKALEVARPKERVEVTVCPADLINYEYTIEKTEEKLQEGFSIVGAGTVFDVVSGAGTIALGGTLKAEDFDKLCRKPEKVDILACYKSIRARIGTQRDEVKKAVAPVADAASGRLFEAGGGCSEWPDKITAVAADAGGKPRFHAEHTTQTDLLEALEKDRQLLLTRIKDVQFEALASKKSESDAEEPASEGDAGEKPENAELLEQLKQDLEVFGPEITALQSVLDNARNVVDRWAKIMAHNPEPKLSQTFLMPQTSTRFTIGVKRKPISPESRKELTETDSAKIQPMLIATTTFENRAFHRFNVSMGMAAAGRDNSKDFELVSSLNPDGNAVYHVRESKRDELEFEAATFLGIYFNAIDNYDPKRGRAWMLMLGTEISGSPSDFFLGLGLDTPKGVVFGFGITEYEGTSLADGWKVGQEVPAITTGTDAGKPRIAAVPKKKEDTIGVYVFAGFRPSIFRAFLDRRKP